METKNLEKNGMNNLERIERKNELENPNLERPYLDCDGKNLYINVDRIASKIPSPVKRTCENIRNYVLKHPVKTIVGLSLLLNQILWTDIGYETTKYQLDNGKTRIEIESKIKERMNDLPLKIIEFQTKPGRGLAYLLHDENKIQFKLEEV